MRKVSIPLPQSFVRSVKDPIDPDIVHHRALVPVDDLPVDLPKGLNPRDVRETTTVARRINESLWRRDGNFHLLNRGLTILVEDCQYDTKDQQLKLIFGDEDHGILDGLHTYTLIKKALKSPNWKSNSATKQFVWLETLSKVKNLAAVEIVEARNTSVQVKPESIGNLRNFFDFIKDALKNEPFSEVVGYNENAIWSDDDVEMSVKEIIRLMTLFNVERYPSNTHPMKAYTSVRGVMVDFDKECEISEQAGDKPPRPRSYFRLVPILPDILRLHDHLYKQYPTYYAASNACTTPKDARFRALVEIKSADRILHFLSDKSNCEIPNGLLFPVLASLRCLLEQNGDGAYKWKENPFKFLDRVGPQMVEKVLNFSKDVGRDPNKLGKSKSLWEHLYLFAEVQKRAYFI